ncbi:hypothetical protein ENTCAN_05501 [Enterobacter cancerogenus ATCC 35316]|nr:hypothetical protein ENTCAN_05501 [Enterobacter cancerogenus ATCC 35316]
MLAIILFCNVNFRQVKVSLLKLQPRQIPCLLRFISTKHLRTKNKPQSYCDY